MSERIDQWAAYCGERSMAAFSSREAAVEWIGGNPSLRLVHRIELRDNDEITPKGKLAEVDKICGEMTDRALKAERELNAAIERASNAEIANVRIALDATKAKAERDEWKSRALAAESALNDAAAKYERETAAKLLVEVYCSNCADNGDYSDEVANATSVAALLRSHYFPPAKEV